jgi:hypothetical protein
VSRRLLDAMAGALGVSADALGRSGGMPSPAMGSALFRAESAAAAGYEEDLEALSQAALSPAPPPMDELDRLFLGGPEA